MQSVHQFGVLAEIGGKLNLAQWPWNRVYIYTVPPQVVSSRSVMKEM